MTEESVRVTATHDAEMKPLLFRSLLLLRDTRKEDGRSSRIKRQWEEDNREEDGSGIR